MAPRVCTLVLSLSHVGVTCDNLDPPTNGEVVFGNGFGETATYSCSVEFMLNGSAQRSCGADGEFTGVAPTCVRKSPNPTFYVVLNDSRMDITSLATSHQ